MADTFETPWSGVETAGSPALSLANTLDWRLRDTPVEQLHTYEDLLRWARTADCLTPAEAVALRARSAGDPDSGERVLREAVALREAMAALWDAASQGEAFPAGPLGLLSRAAVAARGAQSLQAEGSTREGPPAETTPGSSRSSTRDSSASERASTASWRWRRVEPEMERPLWAAALEGAQLLVSPAIHRVRQCGDAECGWFFLDASKNRSRRWCSMESCGNRNKARRYSRRSRRSGEPLADRG